LLDDTTGSGVAWDDGYLAVVDSTGTLQYLLTTSTSPAITVKNGYFYYVSEIDVTGFPSGNITLSWTATVDGYDYAKSYTVQVDPNVSLQVMADLSHQVQDSQVILDSAKQLSILLMDAAGNRYDGYACRAKVQDWRNLTLVETIDLSLVSTGSGLWSVSHTFTTANYTAALDRYEIWYEFQESDGGAWTEVEDSRMFLRVQGATNDVIAGPLSYCSPSDVRKTFPGIDKYLMAVNDSVAERDLVLLERIREASLHIDAAIKNTQMLQKRDLLRKWCAWEAIYDILITAHRFAQFGIADDQLKEIRRKIAKTRVAIFGHSAFIRVGRPM